MKTIVTFKVLSERKIKYKNISIEHNFEIIPSCLFNGIELPATSIEEQVIDMLDKQDKRQLMIENDWDIILDYYIKRKKDKKSELKSFIEFCTPYLDLYPQFKIPFEAVINNSKDILFGKGKSNETKFKEVLNLVDISFKAIQGTINLLEKSLKNKNDKKEGNNNIIFLK